MKSKFIIEQAVFEAPEYYSGDPKPSEEPDISLPSVHELAKALANAICYKGIGQMSWSAASSSQLVSVQIVATRVRGGAAKPTAAIRATLTSLVKVPPVGVRHLAGSVSIKIPEDVLDDLPTGPKCPGGLDSFEHYEYHRRVTKHLTDRLQFGEFKDTFDQAVAALEKKAKKACADVAYLEPRPINSSVKISIPWGTSVEKSAAFLHKFHYVRAGDYAAGTVADVVHAHAKPGDKVVVLMLTPSTPGSSPTRAAAWLLADDAGIAELRQWAHGLYKSKLLKKL